jgi:hypothetical protein
MEEDTRGLSSSGLGGFDSNVGLVLSLQTRIAGILTFTKRCSSSDLLVDV